MLARGMRGVIILGLLVGLVGCTARSKHEEAARKLLARVRGTSVFGPSAEYVPSELPDVGGTGMFPVRSSSECEVAILSGGEDSFAARMNLLARAKHSIRIQALIF